MNVSTSTNAYATSSWESREEKMALYVKSKSSKRSNRKVKSYAANMVIEEPEDSDVLCGRGRGFFEHPGNRRMLAIIAQFKPEYQTASKIEKSAITQRVLQIILEPQHGGARPRFLKQAGNPKQGSVGGQWLQLCEKEIHKKIAHTLREQKTIVRLPQPTTKDGTSCSEGHQAPGLVRIVSDADSSSSSTLDVLKELRKKFEAKTALIGAVNPVSDDEASSSSYDHSETPVDFIDDFEKWQRTNNKSGRKDQSIAKKVVISRSEPLSFQQEPVFSEGEIDTLLHIVMDDELDEDDDAILDSFLDGIDLFSSIRSMCSV